jgi:hypothetical protein
LFQLSTYQKPLAAEFYRTSNIHPIWMPFAGRFSVHQHFNEVEKRHTVDPIQIVIRMMGVVEIVMIKRHF